MKVEIKHKKFVVIIIFLLLLFIGKKMVGSGLAVAQVKAVMSGPIYSYISAVGLVEPCEEAVLVAQTGAELKQILLWEGQPVKIGQPIMLLDSLEVQKNVAEANNNYEKARLGLAEAGQRVYQNKQLLDIMAIAQADFDKSYELLKQARLNYGTCVLVQRLARQRINSLNVAAPLSGTLVEVSRQLKAGSLVLPGQFLCRVAKLNQLKVSANIDELEAATLKLGQKVLISCQGYQDKVITGEVSFIAPVIHQVQGIAKVPVKITLLDNSLNLKPGNNVELKIIKQQKDLALLVPQEALVSEGEQQFVYLVNRGQVEKVAVEPGLSDIKNVEIMASGLIKANDNVLISDPANFKVGQKVKINHAAL